MTHQTNTNNPTDFPPLTTQELLSGVWPMPPSAHQPDNWLFLRCQDDERDYYRILSCWHDDWRVSSEVVVVEQYSDHWRVVTHTGSEYTLMAGRNNPTQSAQRFATRVVQHWQAASPQEWFEK